MNTILLYADYTDLMSYYNDWVDAFVTHKHFCAKSINLCNEPTSLVIKNIANAELIILHHSITADTLKYITPFITALQSRRGKLVCFVGNEVNLPALGMRQKIAFIKEIQADIIATQLLQEAGNWLYADCKSSKVLAIPHALNYKAFTCDIEQSTRSIDIGTRTTKYNIYVGDNERNQIVNYFDKNKEFLGINVDLGLDKTSQQRFSRTEWNNFLNQCKATVATEAGTFYLDRDDSTLNNIQNYIKGNKNVRVISHNHIAIRVLKKVIPHNALCGLKNLFKAHITTQTYLDDDVSIEDIKELFFKDEQKCPIYSKCISSRHFDAIGAKTLQIMYPGRYNDILTAGEHYFELKNDHSNINELIALLRDPTQIQKITSNTLEYILDQHTHKHRLDFLAANI